MVCNKKMDLIYTVTVTDRLNIRSTHNGIDDMMMTLMYVTSHDKIMWL